MLTFLELRRILFRAPVLFMLLFVAPLLAATCSIVGTYKPTVIKQDSISAMTKLDSLYAEFAEGNWKSYADYKDELLTAWVAFGGTEEITGAYYNFYQNSPKTGPVLQNNFAVARDAFCIFYDVYERHVKNAVRVFILAKDYDIFCRGVEGLHEYMKPDATYSDAFLDLTVRKRCNEIRIQTPFRRIINSIRTQSLTEVQANDLVAKHGRIMEVISAIPPGTEKYDLLIADFASMGHEYINHYLALYQADTFTGKASRYYGFSDYQTAHVRTEIIRIDWLFEHAEPSFDFSSAPEFRRLMHPPSGISTIDFLHNNIELITIPLIIFAILVTIFCIFSDIKKKTIISTVVSPNGRTRIILAKIFASLIAVTLTLLMFILLYWAASAFIVGSVSTPTVLFVLGGKFVLKLPPVAYFLFYLLTVVIKLFLAVIVTAMTCLIIQNWRGIFIFAAAFAVTFGLLDWFVKPFSCYLVVWSIIPVLIIIIFAFAKTIRSFKRRDFN